MTPTLLLLINVSLGSDLFTFISFKKKILPFFKADKWNIRWQKWMRRVWGHFGFGPVTIQAGFVFPGVWFSRAKKKKLLPFKRDIETWVAQMVCGCGGKESTGYNWPQSRSGWCEFGTLGGPNYPTSPSPLRHTKSATSPHLLEAAGLTPAAHFHFSLPLAPFPVSLFIELPNGSLPK